MWILVFKSSLIELIRCDIERKSIMIRHNISNTRAVTRRKMKNANPPGSFVFSFSSWDILLRLHTGQLYLMVNHVLIHVTWKQWPHRSAFVWTFIGSKQMEHVSSTLKNACRVFIMVMTRVNGTCSYTNEYCRNIYLIRVYSSRSLAACTIHVGN